MPKKVSFATFAIILPFLLASCGSPDQPVLEPYPDPEPVAEPPLASMEYQVPRTTARRPTALLPAGMDPLEALERSVDILPGARVEETSVHSIHVVTYSGPPADFIDCGTLHQSEPDGSVRVIPMNARQVMLPPAQNRPDSTLVRRLRLDARIMITPIYNTDGTTQLFSDSYYVVTLNVDMMDASQVAIDGGKETIGFHFGEEGHFSGKTRCRATGELEARLFRGAGDIGMGIVSNDGPI